MVQPPAAMLPVSYFDAWQLKSSKQLQLAPLPLLNGHVATHARGQH